MRNGYTVLDLLSDIGGIIRSIMTGAAIFLYVWTYKSLDYYMVSKLYGVVNVRNPDKIDKLDSTTVRNIKECIR